MEHHQASGLDMVVALLAAGVPMAVGLILLLALVVRKGPVRLCRATGLPGSAAIARELAWQDKHPGRERNNVIG